MTYTALTFRSGETVCDAWHFRGAGDRFASPSGRPVVVMAHGIAGTKDSGLEPFGRRLSNAGVDVVAFDYRGFGASGANPAKQSRSQGKSTTIGPPYRPCDDYPTSTRAECCSGECRSPVATSCGSRRTTERSPV